MHPLQSSRSRPSKACGPCREKRRKCDLKEPTCSQCRRARVSCPGYRDAFTLRLRDESLATARRVQARTLDNYFVAAKQTSNGIAVQGPSAALTVRAPWTSISDASARTEERLQESLGTSVVGGSISETHSEEDDVLQAIKTSVPPRSIGASTNLTEAALNFFMHTYAVQSVFAYLPELYSSIPQRYGEDLDFLISVPALVLLSQDLRDPRLLRIAYSRHVKAILSTQKALASPDLAVNDVTLLSVLLLGLFEALVFNGRGKSDNWVTHVQGSAALLNIRGKSQFNSALGQSLFLHCSGNIAASCALRCIPIPPFLKPLQQYASSKAADHLGIRLELAMDTFAALRAKIKGLSIAQHVQMASELDQEISSLLDAMNVFAPCQRIVGAAATVQQVRSYRGCIHRYPSLRIARRWNDLRIVRLFVNEHISTAITSFDESELDIDSSPLECPRSPSWSCVHEQAVHSAEAVIADILHGVPYFVELSTNPSITAKSLIFPLSAIAISDLAPPSAKLFARERLAYIGIEYGIVQARESVDMVFDRSNLEHWILLPHWS
ncbi:hypothetical protein HD806DRAFT_523894 [Xylariaceae sp. AK1471]|nr:hypothetical protein HD806DRAFT_523894 [Xylariaceae sp. AK1471]